MSQLTSLVLPLEVTSGALAPHAHGELAQACFLRGLVEPLDAVLARDLHDRPGAHPYTLSPLNGPFEVQPEGLHLPAGAVFRWRITGLNAPVSRLLRHLAVRPLPELALGRARLQPLPAILNAEEDAEAHQLDYLELCELAKEAAGEMEQVRLAFLTPASFHAQWRPGAPAADVALPLPHLVFAGLWHRWLRFAPPQTARFLPREALDPFLARLEMGDFELRSALDRFRKAPRRGCLGWCDYRLRGVPTPTEHFALRLLAEYAFFAGVGRGTTYGSGQTRPVPHSAPRAV